MNPAHHYVNLGIAAGSFINGTSVEQDRSIDSAGIVYEWTGSAWQAVSTNGAALVTDSVPKSPVTPTYAGNPTPSFTIAGAPTRILCALLLINSADNLEAGTAFFNGHPGVPHILANEIVKVHADSAITRVSVIFKLAAGTHGALSMSSSSLETDVQSNLRTFIFSAADNIRDVNIGFIDTGTVGDATIFCEGLKS